MLTGFGQAANEHVQGAADAACCKAFGTEPEFVSVPSLRRPKTCAAKPRTAQVLSLCRAVPEITQASCLRIRTRAPTVVMLPAKKAGSTPTPPSFAAQAGRRWTCCFPPQSFADSAVRRKATSPAKERLTPITIRLQPSCLLFLDDSENSHHGSRLHAGRRSEKTRTGSAMPCVSGTCSRTPGRRQPKAPRQGAASLNAAVTEPERPLSRTPEEAQAQCLRPRRLSAAGPASTGINASSHLRQVAPATPDAQTPQQKHTFQK